MQLWEAMASKTAVVCSNVGAVPDLIKDGENGFLFEPGDYKEMARLIDILAVDDELRIDFSEQGFSDIEQNFSLNAIIPKF